MGQYAKEHSIKIILKLELKFKRDISCPMEFTCTITAKSSHKLIFPKILTRICSYHLPDGNPRNEQ